MAIEAVNDETFERVVLEAEQLVVVHFWAPLAGPCRLVTPVLEEMATELHGQVLFVKMSVDENSAVPKTYAIDALPTLLPFRKGNVLEKRVGASPKSKILSWVKGLM